MKIFMQVLPFVVVESFVLVNTIIFCVSRSCRIYDTLLLSSWPSSSSTVYCIDKEKRDTTKASLLTIILCSIHLTMYFSTQSLLATCRLRCTYNVVEVCCLCYLRSVAVVTVGFSLDGGKWTLLFFGFIRPSWWWSRECVCVCLCLWLCTVWLVMVVVTVFRLCFVRCFLFQFVFDEGTRRNDNRGYLTTSPVIPVQLPHFIIQRTS